MKDVKFRVSETGSAQVENHFGKIENRLFSLKGMAGKLTGVLGGIFAVSAISNFMQGAIANFKEAENGIIALTQAYGKNSQSLQDYASELQKSTVYGDDAIIQAETIFASFNKNEEQIKKLTKATLDYASANKMDLVSSANLINRTFSTSMNALRRQGIEVEGLAKSEERLNSILGAVNEKFGGRAQSEALSFAGKLTQIENASGDLQETFIAKSGLVYLVDLFTLKLDIMEPVLNAVAFAMRGISIAIATVVGIGSTLIVTLEGLIDIFPKVYKSIQENLDPSKLFVTMKPFLALMEMLSISYEKLWKDMTKRMPDLKFNIDSLGKGEKGVKNLVGDIAKENINTYQDLSGKIKNIWSETSKIIENIAKNEWKFGDVDYFQKPNQTLDEMLGKMDKLEDKSKGMLSYLYGDYVDALTEANQSSQNGKIGLSFKNKNIIGEKELPIKPILVDWEPIKTDFEIMSNYFGEHLFSTLQEYAGPIWQSFFGKANSFIEQLAQKIGSDLLVRAGTGLFNSLLGLIPGGSAVGGILDFLGLQKQSYIPTTNNNTVLVQIGSEQIYKSTYKTVPSVLSELYKRRAL